MLKLSRPVDAGDVRARVTSPADDPRGASGQELRACDCPRPTAPRPIAPRPISAAPAWKATAERGKLRRCMTELRWTTRGSRAAWVGALPRACDRTAIVQLDSAMRAPGGREGAAPERNAARGAAPGAVRFLRHTNPLRTMPRRGGPRRGPAYDEVASYPVERGDRGEGPGRGAGARGRSARRRGHAAGGAGGRAEHLSHRSQQNRPGHAVGARRCPRPCPQRSGDDRSASAPRRS